MSEQNEKKYLERASYNWSEDSVRLIQTPSPLAKSIYFYVQETGYFKTDDTYFTERQNLNSFLIVYTLSGKGRLCYQNKSYDLTEGTCFYINCMEHHYYETVKRNEWEFLWLHFNSQNALGYYEEFTRNGFQIIECQNPSLIESDLRQILSLNQKKNISTELLSSGLIIHILTELSLHTMTGSIQPLSLPDYLKEILKEIDHSLRTPLTLESLAAKAGVSKFHLSREFKKYVGFTVNEYIISARISYAKELLKYSSLPVSEIAYQSGMNHISHFINPFKARENMTPLQYRRE